MAEKKTYEELEERARKLEAMLEELEHREYEPRLFNAIDRAIDEMPDSFESKKFMTAHRAEVKDMCLIEYNEMETIP